MGQRRCGSLRLHLAHGLARSGGHDIIYDFDAGQDVIDLLGLDVTSWSAADPVGGQTIVNIYTGGQTAAPDMEIQLADFTGVLDDHNFLLV